MHNLEKSTLNESSESMGISADSSTSRFDYGKKSQTCLDLIIIQNLTCILRYTATLPNSSLMTLGKRVILTHYFDANLIHDILSGKAVTGCVHMANKIPMMWYSRKQATSETATYCSEFVSGRTCVEQVIDLENSFRHLRVPINDISYVLGDKETMINSSSYPHAKLHKRHNILSYH